MTTKELIRAEINKIDETDLEELYKLIQLFVNTKEQVADLSEKTTLTESGLCGIWQDDRSAEEIVEDIVGSRSQGRDLEL
jgi:hypothetical protein